MEIAANNSDFLNSVHYANIGEFTPEPFSAITHPPCPQSVRPSSCPCPWSGPSWFLSERREPVAPVALARKQEPHHLFQGCLVPSATWQGWLSSVTYSICSGGSSYQVSFGTDILTSIRVAAIIFICCSHNWPRTIEMSHVHPAMKLIFFFSFQHISQKVGFLHSQNQYIYFCLTKKKMSKASMQGCC